VSEYTQSARQSKEKPRKDATAKVAKSQTGRGGDAKKELPGVASRTAQPHRQVVELPKDDLASLAVHFALLRSANYFFVSGAGG
jgi:hypothetical protein